MAMPSVLHNQLFITAAWSIILLIFYSYLRMLRLIDFTFSSEYFASRRNAMLIAGFSIFFVFLRPDFDFIKFGGVEVKFVGTTGIYTVLLIINLVEGLSFLSRFIGEICTAQLLTETNIKQNDTTEQMNADKHNNGTTRLQRYYYIVLSTLRKAISFLLASSSYVAIELWPKLASDPSYGVKLARTISEIILPFGALAISINCTARLVSPEDFSGFFLFIIGGHN